jgi:hypothetical protein
MYFPEDLRLWRVIVSYLGEYGKCVTDLWSYWSMKHWRYYHLGELTEHTGLFIHNIACRKYDMLSELF